MGSSVSNAFKNTTQVKKINPISSNPTNNNNFLPPPQNNFNMPPQSNFIPLNLTPPLIPKVVDNDLDKVYQLIYDLSNMEKREEALHELSKKKENFSNLAPLLWNSVGTVAIL